jgi:hypothetical protein
MVRILLLILCVGVVLQLLGLPCTLMDTMAGSDDDPGAPAGFTLLATLPVPVRISPSHAQVVLDIRGEPFTLVRSIFHPPPFFS